MSCRFVTFLVVVATLNAAPNELGCWTSVNVQTACCAGAWGGAGCWEGGRTFDDCCTVKGELGATFAIQPTSAPKDGSCEARLARIVGALSRGSGRPSLWETLAAPVEQKVRHETRKLRLGANASVAQRAMAAPTRASFAKLTQPPSSMLENDMLLDLMTLVANVLEARSITHWAHNQTLVGLLRHYGPVPWDATSASFGAFALEEADVEYALVEDIGRRTHPSFGQVQVVAAPCEGVRSDRCGGHWNVFFSRRLSYPGARSPAVSVEWFDARGQSASWKRHLGDGVVANSARFVDAYRNVLSYLLPIRYQRPFAQLRLPVPRDSWGFVGTHHSSFGNGAQQHALERCRGAVINDDVALPCATLAALYPMVLFRRAFLSVTELLRLYGGNAAKLGAVQEAATSAARAANGKRRLKLSVEVAADATRGAHILLFGEEEKAGDICWKQVFGSHQLVRGTIF